MDHIQSLSNSTLTRSSLDLLLAVPRLAQRAGEFALIYLPEQLDAIIGKARSGGSMIADPTAPDTNHSAIMTSLGQFVQNSIASATASPTTSGTTLDTASPFSMTSIRSFGGIFSYLMSKWALATVITAIVLNRTQFYASSRVPLNLRWYLRLSLYLIPIATFLFQIVRILQALRCQTSPHWPSMQYGKEGQTLEIDYAAEGGFLHWLSSALLFWEDEMASCDAVNMLPKGGETLRAAGSMKLLWPLFCSLGLSQFIETLACSLQGRTPMPETGMTIFEHSLAFAEAEATITRPFIKYAARAAKAASSASSPLDTTIKTVTRSALLQATNVPSEVLVISLISSLSHLSSNVLAVAGLRTKLRLVNTGIWGLSYLGVFMWSFSRAVSGVHQSTLDTGILRFPTVCIVGFIPHLLIFIGMFGCAVIYGMAMLLTAIALPPVEDGPEGFIARVSARISAAYSNLQVNVYLRATPAIRINWNEDFYTALLKIGFTVLTAASEAVYLNEGTKVAVHSSTWLEEKRIKEFVRERKGLQRSIECIPVELVEDSIADGVVSLNDATGSVGIGHVSGYSRERKARGRQGTANNTVIGREHGVGFVQRRSRWVLAFQFLTGLVWLIIGLAARATLSTLQTLRLPYRPRWLSRVIGPESISLSTLAPKSQQRPTGTHPDTLQFWVVQPDGSLGIPDDDEVDVELESRRRYHQQQNGADVEQRLDSYLYDWWKTGGWWGNIDSSGDFEAAVYDDDDLTSIISTTDASEIDWVESEPEDGRRTPTQSNPCPQSRDSTPIFDDLLDSTHLATLLDPTTPLQQEEARLLASHLRSSKPLTRLQHRKAVAQERSRILTSSVGYSTADRTPEEEERALETFLLERRSHSDASKARLNGESGSWAAGAEGMGSGGPQCVVCQASPRTRTNQASSMGRPRKYDYLDNYQTEIIALYTDNTTVSQLMVYLQEKHGITVPDRSIKRRLRDWGIYKHRRKVQTDEIKDRIQGFWDEGLLDDDMTKILKDEGYPMSKGSVRRLRTEMGLKRRDANGGRGPYIAQPTRDASSSIPMNQPAKPVSEELENTSRQVITDDLADRLDRPLQTPIPPSVQDPARSPQNSTESTPTGKRKRGCPRKDPNDHSPKKARYTPRQKGKAPTSSTYHDPNAPDPPFTREEFDRIREENIEVRQLMDALRDEADDSKAKMLTKARDDAAKYRQIQQLEAEITALRVERDRLLHSAGDERALAIQTSKNAEIDRLKGVMADTRRAFEGACVRVFRYQSNCRGFIEDLRRRDPNQNGEATESEVLCDDLETVFTEPELRSIRAQI
ncbi:hypothetical protein EJ05DRAFT_512938 [Pseudovirgaria hyperparasitica]|uniref:Clr5 domain-containing protein n=1 Tax=Pseudovirgaria hyperparasitica TaxID=470096 RepID=A0A6A6VYS2_9PEZI|nr:uncharacterized protein EJ05DRAFT_512938 [Pseudovirgaria hyperparasitica]KAF2755423.1 hypothetical protein EJ05DRAFT_512938 [Pseudovirgaria hyperparasitica]